MDADEKEVRRKRQREVSLVGEAIEKRIMQILAQDNKIREECIIGHGPAQAVRAETFVLRDFERDESVELPHLILSVKYTRETGEEVYMYMDADIVIYHKLSRRIVCVISSKKSFRERGAQSAYWSLKKTGRDFKYIIVTPDSDFELYNPDNPYKQAKWRTILENEMAAVFVIDKGPPFKSRNFYVGNDHLKNCIRELLLSQTF
ncbi:conserved hypothetical protein [Hydrogenobacter thermophilus TK-6]|uniref:BsaWI restriction endonuclease type 2 domain-containing protein n=1 Tax=Hydrogenobacter thermophilus (strain DSM 6534 / IAM 12695 / TK-6) TaxID=608538 RepID=D3DFT7_HYDTT|nr:BsaWI family type II restriction enzyme [Hydrogenobacter thermophilus]ADO44629.1 conserved hypothetical protein [Hydrogenobacter thermophilus TK-6]BAI68689.1 hypothetical protein HTH_0222 [Hydrogenobacter thermophilus TK-6]